MKPATVKKVSSILDRWNNRAKNFQSESAMVTRLTAHHMKAIRAADGQAAWSREERNEEKSFIKRRYLNTALRLARGEQLNAGDKLCWNFARYGNPQALLSRVLTRAEIKDVCNELAEGGFVFSSSEPNRVIGVVTPADKEQARREAAIRAERIARGEGAAVAQEEYWKRWEMGYH